MPTITTGLFFLRKQKFAEAGRDEQGFRLTLRLLDRQGPHATEPYVVTWRGEEAQAWWQAHGTKLAPGTPLHVELTNPRSFPGVQAPETHATACSLRLAPVAPNWADRSPQHAAAAI